MLYDEYSLVKTVLVFDSYTKMLSEVFSFYLYQG